MDIVVTTPKFEIENARKEAEWTKKQGGGPGVLYFRKLNRAPSGLKVGDRIFYVEGGFVRGFCKVSKIGEQQVLFCEVTGREFRGACIVYMRADSWKWILPIPIKGFQGFRYFKQKFEIVGDWLDERPFDKEFKKKAGNVRSTDSEKID